jgi:hypothetical protein
MPTYAYLLKKILGKENKSCISFAYNMILQHYIQCFFKIVWLLFECTFQNENVCFCIFARIYFTVFVRHTLQEDPRLGQQSSLLV